MHWKFAAQVVRETGLDVLIPVYPLVPRPMATARQIVDGFFEIIRLLDTSGENRVVSIMGHSAGGTIAMAIAQQLPHFSAGLASYVRSLILMAPMLDCAVDHPEALRIVQRDPTGQIAFGRVLAKLWAGDLGVAHPHASPLSGEIDKLPPLLLLCGTDDLLCADARRLSVRFQGKSSEGYREGIKGSYSGEKITYIEEKEMLHVYPLLPHWEGAHAKKLIMAFIKKNSA